MNKKLLKIIDFWIAQDGRLDEGVQNAYDSLVDTFKSPHYIQRFLEIS